MNNNENLANGGTTEQTRNANWHNTQAKEQPMNNRPDEHRALIGEKDRFSDILIKVNIVLKVF